jgi:hypothetical protein
MAKPQVVPISTLYDDLVKLRAKLVFQAKVNLGEINDPDAHAVGLEQLRVAKLLFELLKKHKG